MPDCPYPDELHTVAPGPQQCEVSGDDPKIGTLGCWLAWGHDGPHWDDVDKVHWGLATPCARTGQPS